MREFWVSSGHHLTRRTASGELAVTDELILALLARPELVPPGDACRAERALRANLLASPRRAVGRDEIAAIADPDAQENWRLMLDFRALLLDATSVEAAYRKLVREGAEGVAPLFMRQLTHLILRNALDGCGDPFVLRAGELFFRPQRVSLTGLAAILADAEILEQHHSGHSPLTALLGQEPEIDLDIMDDENAWTYWSRSDAFTMALDFASERSRLGFASVLSAWIRHLLRIRVSVEPVTRIDDADWRWFVGLDREASAIGNTMWHGRPIDPEAMSRLLALFRLDITDRDRVAPRVAGYPVYLLAARDPDSLFRMKPQNLLSGLPLRAEVSVL